MPRMPENTIATLKLHLKEKEGEKKIREGGRKPRRDEFIHTIGFR